MKIINKEGIIFDVTKGAFAGVYSQQGFKPLTKKTKKDKVEDEKNLDEEFINEMLEKPVSQWTKKEIKRFSSLRNIDLSGTKNVSEAKAVIKDFIELELSEEEIEEEVEE